jgi:hypothetical protein
MALNWISSRAGSALALIGIALALANWNARRDAAWAWAASIVMFVVMVAVERRSHLASSRSSGDAASVRSVASVTGAVAIGALMMIIPLAMSLAHAYGVVDDPDGGQRATMIVFGSYLVAFGNSLPRMLPPVSSLQCNGARIQAFQRLAGWTWTLCGLGFATAWLVLPIEVAETASTALMAAAMIVTIVQLLRLRKPRQHAPGLN